MDYLYQVYDTKDNLLVSTRNFDLALYIYSTAGAQNIRPRFTWKALAEPFPILLVPGYPGDIFQPLA